MTWLSIVANIAVIILEVISLRMTIIERHWKVFAFYTQLSNIITLISSVAYLCLGAAAAPVRYLSTCMMVMTFLVTLCILAPFGGGFRKMMLRGSMLYHHTLCPAISVVSYFFCEPHEDIWPLPVAVTLAYGIVMMTLNANGLYDGPYPFFRVKNQSRTATVLWTAALFGIIFVISYLCGRLN